MIIPGSVIPKWFIHQSIGAEVNIKEPSSHLCDEWIGTVVCIVFSSHLEFSLSCQFIANGKVMSSTVYPGLCVDSFSDHIWLFYLLPQYYKEKDIKLLNEWEANGLSQIGIKIETHKSGVEVKKCGFRMVYKKDIEELKRTKDLGVLHHSFDNLVVVAEDNKAKQIRDNFDGEGPCGEGSYNDVPHPNRIERLHGDFDCEEYFECGEEIND